MFNESTGEWAWYVGQDNRNRCWLTHPGDVAVKNPHYFGPPRPHPEDDGAWLDEPECPPMAALLEARKPAPAPRVQVPADYDDIPF